MTEEEKKLLKAMKEGTAIRIRNLEDVIKGSKHQLQTAHKQLDDADIERGDLMLTQRIKLLRDERNAARAIVQAMWGVMYTSLALSLAPDVMPKLHELAEERAKEE